MEQQRGKERMNRDGIFIIVAAALLGACGSDATIETGSDLAALKLVASSYHEAATAKDREGVIAFYDRNAIMVPPNDDLVENYEKVRKELLKYSNKLEKKKEIVVFNKIDMVTKEEINKKLDAFRKKINKKVLLISALKRIGLKDIKENLFAHVH